MTTYAISNLAWDQADESAVVLPLLREHGFTGIEVAPTKLFPDLWNSAPSKAEVSAYRDRLSQEGFEVAALQSIIYGRPELQLFGSESEQDDFLEALEVIFALAQGLGAKPLVFGSPKNRIKGDLTHQEALEVAAKFFTKAAKSAQDHGVQLCIEANPAEYNGDFVLNTKEAFDLVKMVDHPSIRLHLDTGGMHLAQDDLAFILNDYLPWVDHFHVSNPFLKDFASTPVDHQTYGGLLGQSEYDGAISIEMLPPELGVEGIKNALSYVQRHY